jgi:hypothetical protein
MLSLPLQPLLTPAPALAEEEDPCRFVSIHSITLFMFYTHSLTEYITQNSPGLDDAMAKHVLMSLPPPPPPPTTDVDSEANKVSAAPVLRRNKKGKGKGKEKAASVNVEKTVSSLSKPQHKTRAAPKTSALQDRAIREEADLSAKMVIPPPSQPKCKKSCSRSCRGAARC